MKLSIRLNNAKKKPKTAKRSTFITKSFQALVANRRAISAVVSNMILIGAVISVGLVVLAWSQYQSANYQMNYTNDVNENIAKVQEKVVFEYVVHNDVSRELKVYLLNCGIQNVTIHDVYANVNNVDQHFTNVNLVQLDGSPWADNVLPVNKQGYFSVTVSGSGTCIVRIITGRGSTFVGSS
jgi:hypothetical protein